MQRSGQQRKRQQICRSAGCQRGIQSELDGDDDRQNRAQDAGSRVHRPSPLHEIRRRILAGWSGNTGNSLAGWRRARRPVGNGMPMAKPSGISRPGTDQQLQPRRAGPPDGSAGPAGRRHKAARRPAISSKCNPYAPGFGQPPAGNHAARSARKQKQEHHYGQRVNRVSEKQDEALDESDLHQNVSQADGDEVKQTDRTKLLTSSAAWPEE